MAETSTASVSHFINCAETIPLSAEKRMRIMEAMRKTNYRPNAASSQLSRNSVIPKKVIFIFGSYVQYNPLDICKNPMLSELISVLAAELKKDLGLSFEVRSVENEDSIEAWNEAVVGAEAVVCYAKLDTKLLDLSTRRNIPLVFISDNKTIPMRGPDGSLPQLDYIYWDAAIHLEKILKHVMKKGARRLAFVSSWNIRRNNPEGFAVEAETKIDEFNAFISANGLYGELFFPSKPEELSPYYEGLNVYEFMRSKDLKSFDAIIGHNDFVAQGISWAMQACGIRPGHDVMVCGEGDYVECRYAMPRPTTVSYDKFMLAKHVGSILQRRLQDNRPLGEHLLVPSTLFERDTT